MIRRFKTPEGLIWEDTGRIRLYDHTTRGYITRIFREYDPDTPGIGREVESAELYLDNINEDLRTIALVMALCQRRLVKRIPYPRLEEVTDKYMSDEQEKD